MKIFITGATGYIGKNLTLMAVDRGHEVVMATRRPQVLHCASWFHYDLESANVIDLPIKGGVIVHLAANTKNSIVLDEEVEFAAAKSLISAADKAGSRLIFISSQTARLDAPTSYGRIKWRIEQEVLAFGGWVVRPGLVYGNELSGLYGVLVATVQNLPFLPLFIPPPKVQPIHVNDLVDGVLRLAERGNLESGIYCLASPLPINFSSFLSEIADNRLRIRRYFIPVPLILIKYLLDLIGNRLRTHLGLNRLYSLFDLEVMETVNDLHMLGLSLRPLEAGLHPAGNNQRRKLLREGNAFLAYILKKQPSISIQCRYVRAIEHVRDGNEFSLPSLFMNFPILLILIDKNIFPNGSLKGEDFKWRMDTAILLAEASPEGAERFLGCGQKHWILTNISLISAAIVAEIIVRMLRYLTSPLLRHMFAKKKDLS